MFICRLQSSTPIPCALNTERDEIVNGSYSLCVNIPAAAIRQKLASRAGNKHSGRVIREGIVCASKMQKNPPTATRKQQCLAICRRRARDEDTDKEAVEMWTLPLCLPGHHANLFILANRRMQRGQKAESSVFLTLDEADPCDIFTQKFEKLSHNHAVEVA